MFQIDEKVLADSRTLITVQNKKDQIESLTKNGTLHYTMEGQNLWLTTPKVRTAYLSRENHLDKYDKVVLARNGIDIDGIYSFDNPITFKDNVEVKKDILIRGNLTVEGDTSIIDTPRLSIEDNIIELNRNENGNGITLRNSGIAVNRGLNQFARNLYNEDNKAFVFDLSPEIDSPLDATKWVAMGYTDKNGEYEAGEFRARHRLTAPFGKFTDSLSVANNTSLNNLTVAGPSVFSGAILANSDETINGTLIANGSATFNNLLTANKIASFKDNVNIDKVLTVTGASTFGDRTTHKKGITVETLGANIVGPVDIMGTLKTSDSVIFKKDLTVTAKTTTGGLSVTNETSTGSLSVTSTSLLGGATTVASTLNVIDKTTMNAVDVNNAFVANSTSTFNGNITVSNKNVVINSNAENNGTILVGGHATFGKTITVDGDATFNSSVNISGALTMENSDILASNVTVKNDFKIQQGDGKGIKFWDSDNYKIYMSSYLDTLMGGRLDSTSDYNMYFKMSSGTNRGFVFKSGNTPVAQIESTGQVRTIGKVIIQGYDALTRVNEGHKTDATGINADKLDSLHATDFLRRNVDTDTTAAITFNTAGKAIKFNGGGAIFKNGAVIIQSDNAINNGVKVQSEGGVDLLTVKDHAINGLLYKTHKVYHAGNHGHGSGLDADTLDGQHKEYFATATHLHDDRYIRNDEVDLKMKYRIEYNEEFDSLDFMYIG